MSRFRYCSRLLKNLDASDSCLRQLIQSGFSEFIPLRSSLVEYRQQFERLMDLGSAPAEPASHKSEREPDPAGLDGGGEAGHTPGQAVAGAEGERRTPGPSARPRGLLRW